MHNKRERFMLFNVKKSFDFWLKITVVLARVV